MATTDVSSIHFNQGRTVVFNLALTNFGSSYNTSTGIFTCSVPGVYHFTGHVMSRYNYFLSMRLVVNGITMTTMYDRRPNGEREAHADGLSAVLHLNKDDRVAILADPDTSMEMVSGPGYVRSNVFAGFLLQRDDCNI